MEECACDAEGRADDGGGPDSVDAEGMDVGVGGDAPPPKVKSVCADHEAEGGEENQREAK